MEYMFSQPSTTGNPVRTSEFVGGEAPSMERRERRHPPFRAKFLKPQPGIVAALFRGNGHDTSRTSLVNDDEYVHFSCLLGGVLRASIGGTFISLSIGEGHVGFSPGQRSLVELSPDYRHVEVMVALDVLGELVGGDFERIGDIDAGFIMRATPAGDRALEAALRLARRIEHQGDHPLLLHAALLEFLGWHFEGLHPVGTQGRIPLRDRKQLLAARERLLEDLSDPPTIPELARHVGLNQLRLKQGFKTLFGTSIYALFQQHRMERARKLLRSLSVTETAIMLGYSNVSNFSAAFRKQFGMLPSEARRGCLS